MPVHVCIRVCACVCVFVRARHKSTHLQQPPPTTTPLLPCCSLVIATRYRPVPLLRALCKFVGASRPIVIYHQFREVWWWWWWRGGLFVCGILMFSGLLSVARSVCASALLFCSILTALFLCVRACVRVRAYACVYVWYVCVCMCTAASGVCERAQGQSCGH